MFEFSGGYDFSCAVAYGKITFDYFKDSKKIKKPTFISSINENYYTVKLPPAPQSKYFGEYRIEMKITLPLGQQATAVQWLYISDIPPSDCPRMLPPSQSFIPLPLPTKVPQSSTYSLSSNTIHKALSTSSTHSAGLQLSKRR
jgi:hypothetical protein